MGKKVARWIVAIVALVLVGFVAIPGCKIKLCKGDGCGSGPDVGGWGGGGASAGTAGSGGGGSVGVGGAALDQEIQEANALYAAHPDEVSRGKARASLTALAVSNLVVANAQDPNDQNEVELLVQQYLPDALSQADQWLAALDPSVMEDPVWKAPTYPLDCIYPPYNCSAQTTICPFLPEGHVCHLADCDLGKCPFCPLPFPLPVRSWCSNACFLIGDGTPVGSAVYITFVGGFTVGPICIPK